MPGLFRALSAGPGHCRCRPAGCRRPPPPVTNSLVSRTGAKCPPGCFPVHDRRGTGKQPALTPPPHTPQCEECMQHQHEPTPGGPGDRSTTSGRLAAVLRRHAGARGALCMRSCSVSSWPRISSNSSTWRWNFGFALALARSWGREPTDIAAILFWYFIGMTSGGFLGRLHFYRPAAADLLISMIVFSVSSMVTGFTDNVLVFTVFRALTGASACSPPWSPPGLHRRNGPRRKPRHRRSWPHRASAFSAVPPISASPQPHDHPRDEVWRFIFYAGGLGFVSPLSSASSSSRESPAGWWPGAASGRPRRWSPQPAGTSTSPRRPGPCRPRWRSPTCCSACSPAATSAAPCSSCCCSSVSTPASFL